MKTSIALAVLTLGLAAAPGYAQHDPAPVGFAAEPLIKTTTTQHDEPLSYPTGTPEITSVIATIEPNGHSPLHSHPVPVYVYVLEGDVEVRTEGAEPNRFSAGQAFMEPQGPNIQMFNVGDTPAKTLVVMMGAEGQPHSLAAEQ